MENSGLNIRIDGPVSAASVVTAAGSGASNFRADGTLRLTGEETIINIGLPHPRDTRVWSEEEPTAALYREQVGADPVDAGRVDV